MKSIFKFFNKCIPKKLWQQIFLTLIMLVVLPLFILGTLQIQTSQKAFQASLLQNYKQLAIHTTGEVRESIVGSYQSLLATAAILGTLHADAWRQETVIVELALRNPYFQRISVVNGQGQEVVTSELGTPLQERLEEVPFLKAQKGEANLSNVEISEDGLPYLTIAVPIRFLGKVEHVLMANVELRHIWDMVDSLQFGKTGAAYLVDREGHIIAHPNKKLVMQHNHLPYDEIFQNIQKNLAGSTEIKNDMGEALLVSYASVDFLNWGLVIEQTKKEAFAFSDIMRAQSWVLILGSIFLAMILSLLLSRLIGRFFRHVIRGTHQVAQGNLDYSFKINRRDETGKLLHAFNQMTRRLRKARRMEKLSTIGKAAAVIAHELKNSLVLVKTFIQLLPEKHKDKQFIEDFSQTIPHELDMWQSMLQNMMDLAKQRPIVKVPMDVNGMVQEVIALAHLSIEEKEVDLKVQLDENLPEILGNKDKLKQVVLNLFTNSFEATNEYGEILVCTRKVLEKSNQYVEIQIQNSGEGIRPEVKAHIFEPFFTTKDNGLGLGLSVSQDIIRQHGGEIYVDSIVDRFTVFFIRLPIPEKPLPKVEKSQLVAH